MDQKGNWISGGLILSKHKQIHKNFGFGTWKEYLEYGQKIKCLDFRAVVSEIQVRMAPEMCKDIIRSFGSTQFQKTRLDHENDHSERSLPTSQKINLNNNAVLQVDDHLKWGINDKFQIPKEPVISWFPRVEDVSDGRRTHQVAKILDIPQKEYPHINFTGPLIGANGSVHKKIENESGAKFRIYGQGAETGRFDRGLHCFITGSTCECVDKAIEMIKSLIHTTIVHISPETNQNQELDTKSKAMNSSISKSNLNFRINQYDDDQNFTVTQLNGTNDDYKAYVEVAAFCDDKSNMEWIPLKSFLIQYPFIYKKYGYSRWKTYFESGKQLNILRLRTSGEGMEFKMNADVRKMILSGSGLDWREYQRDEINRTQTVKFVPDDLV